MDDRYEIDLGQDALRAAADDDHGELPRHHMVVEAKLGDASETLVHRIEAFDAVAAVAKVMAVYAAPSVPMPISDLEIAVHTEDGGRLDPVCAECLHQGPSVKPLDEEAGTECLCPTCLQKLMNELVAEGKAESRVGPSGELEYRALDD